MEFATSKGEEILKDEQVSKQLHLISSETQTQTLNKKAVLNRIRNHKCIHKIKSLLHTTAANNGATVDADYYRWIDSGDVFSCP
ncbi:hypothetical protein AtNW77_Chr5g0154341 [Arabidopsis thaliana]|jgi:hypothetical protein|uniref:At5g66985 n=4 Tax=Arabidopsis TaxID=3701 RepID=Q8L9T9_ARATH|nr:uncharacterized protein AT5G66985 [Arabidopsis thaliana]KAG7607595.1 hypothetical protein ISN45_At05g063540 [Arabidopsis thaliana x Arabidopsis arenosa]KAG7614497.1 hypothetical protein ISN44_As05g062790 [Arabidopsis suecica]AAM65764.1 unknown [Arabidopsis thaliana]ABD60684.1 At5g66985 [Arabidopsis thaliana]AED98287.1 hypothetical protein AT5G66985 [Arabidopsis thaliana]|eukprot:NP_569043.1 hypothetical protein AT5G66985 [Arabidopsis thaliana]